MEGLKCKFLWNGRNEEQARPRAHVTLDCRVGCEGHHTFVINIYGELEEYYVDNSSFPDTTKCNLCGNSAGLTRLMLLEVIKQATAWARPDVIQFRADRELEKELWRKLTELAKSQHRTSMLDVVTFVRNARLDILALYRQECNEDFNRLSTWFMTRTWIEAVSQMLEYIPTKTAEEDQDQLYRVNFKDNPFWLNLLGDDPQKRAETAASFYRRWMNNSKSVWGRKSGRMTQEDIRWWLTGGLVADAGNGEADYLLAQVLGVGTFWFTDNGKLYSFWITEESSPGQTFYQMHRMKVPEA